MFIKTKFTERQHCSDDVSVARALRPAERARVVVARLVRGQRRHHLTNAMVVGTEKVMSHCIKIHLLLILYSINWLNARSGCWNWKQKWWVIVQCGILSKKISSHVLVLSFFNFTSFFVRRFNSDSLVLVYFIEFNLTDFYLPSCDTDFYVARFFSIELGKFKQITVNFF